jgi:hypothetical protein
MIGISMITKVEGKLIVDGKELTKLDADILKTLMEKGSASVFDITMKLGKTYVQYISARLRILEKMFNLVVKPERGKFEINPEIMEELRENL